ncbi:hypothetical protein XGA_1843 [Xanthomonas hortorum ATCC 19865]|nr:hypothetical protein XGA_1843 [Xanthomonas hortorum ATCC 19865]
MTEIRVVWCGIVRSVAEIVRTIRDDVVAQIFVADLQAVIYYANAHATTANAQRMQEINIHIDAGHGAAVANDRLPLIGDVPLITQQWVAFGVSGTCKACRLCGGPQHGESSDQ